MIRAFLERQITTAERQLGAPADYLRFILRTSLRAFFTFFRFIRLSAYRRALPVEPFHVARLVATRHQDCGTCVQIEVNLAKKDRVPADVLRAVLDGRPGDLPAELADVYHFTTAVVEQTSAESELRESVRARYGDAALAELAMTIAFCHVYPVTKRALGYAQSCSAVPVKV